MIPVIWPVSESISRCSVPRSPYEYGIEYKSDLEQDRELVADLLEHGGGNDARELGEGPIAQLLVASLPVVGSSCDVEYVSCRGHIETMDVAHDGSEIKGRAQTRLQVDAAESSAGKNLVPKIGESV
jgi:hypothetical protein